MVAIFTGAGTGFERGSGNVVGSAGLLGSAAQGRGGDNLFFNAANGNLLISRQDEFLVGRGPDVGISRTYNSLGDMTDDNQDNWRHSYDRRVFGLTGAVNTAGSTIKRRSGDGSEITYTWSSLKSGYVATDGAGAYDTLTFDGNAWTWTDGDSQIKEIYETRVYGLTGTLNTTGSKVWRRADSGAAVEYTWSGSAYFSQDGHRLSYSGSTWTWTEAGTARTENYDTATPDWRLMFQKDTSNNSLTFTYRDNKLSQVTTANGESTRFTWSSNNITEIAVYGDSGTLLLTRTRYVYDGLNRLTTVTVDKSPTDSSVADGKSYATTYTYHGTSKRVATISQTDGSSIAFTYDGSDRLTSFAQMVTNGVTRTTNISYHTEIVDGVTKKYTKVAASGLETRLDYDDNNFLTKVTAPAADGSAAPQTIHFGYSAKGDLTSVTDAAGQTTTYDHDDNGNVDYIKDRLNHIVTRTYGAKNQLLTETRTGSSQSAPGSSLTSRYVYDDKNRLVATVSAEGHVTRFEYDSYGQMTRTVAVTADHFNLSGFASTDEVFQSQIDSWYTGLTDKSRVMLTERQYDALGNLDWEKAYSARTATGGEDNSLGWSYTDYLYDQAGQLLSRTAAGLSTEHYVYDGLGRTIASTDLGGAKTTIVFHDAATTTTVSVEGGMTRTSVYNKAGELVSTSESPAPVVSENLKPDLTNPAHWTVGGNLEVSTATSVAGQPAWLYTIKANGGGGALSTLGTVNAGETLTFEITLKAQGNTPTHYFGTYGAVAGWGANEISTAQVISGPGAVAQATGSLWSVSGLSTTQETRIRVTRTSPVTEQVYPHFYVGAINGAQVGDNVILSAPSVTRTTPQPAGPTTEYLYDALGRLRSTIQHTDVQGNNGYAQHILYDKAGRMTAQVDHTGAVTEYRYDVNNRVIATTRYANKLTSTQLAQVADPSSPVTIADIRPSADLLGGDLWTWTRYDLEGRVVIATDGDGSTTSYNYDASGQLVRTVGYVNQLSPEQVAALKAIPTLSITLPTPQNYQDAITRIFYDKDGRVIGKLDGLGYLTEIVYDKAGRKVQELVHASAPSSLLYASGTFTELRNSAGTHAADRSTRYVYDGQGLLRYQIDSLGQVVGYVYSDGVTSAGTTHGQVRQTIAYGVKLPTLGTYTIASVETAIATALAGPGPVEPSRTSYAIYDAAGRLAYAIGAEGLVTSYAYNTLGQVIKTVAFATPNLPSSLPSKSTMDTWVASNIANQENRITRSYYNGYGDLAYVVDAEGYVTETLYDPNRRVGSTRRWSGAVAPTDSWTTASVAGAAKGVGTTTSTFTYDHLGRVATAADAANTVTRNVYSATGLLIETIAAEGTAVQVTTAFTYDATGRLKSRTDGHGTAEAIKTSYIYDGVGNLTAVRVADGKPDLVITAYTYDALGRVISVTEGAESPAAATIAYAYDSLGNYKRIKDAEGKITFNYFDKLGRMVATRDPEHYVTETSYTVFGEVASVTRRHNKATNSANAVDYPAYVADAKDSTTRYEYDRLGQVTKVIDAENYKTTTTYNAFGQAQSVTRAGVTTGYQYDKLGRTRIVTDAANIPTTTIYTSNGEIQSVTRAGATTSFEYDVLGRVTKSIDAEGWFETYAYDALGRRTSVTNKIGGVTEYKYDSRGRQIEEVIWVSGAYNGDATLTSTTIVNKFQYDLRGNLLTSIEAWGAPEARTTTYTYDTLNRVVTKTGMAATVTDVRNGMATETATPSETYVYDKRGNVIETRLESVVGTTRTLISRSLAFYDGLSRAVARINPVGAVVYYSYDKNGNVTSTRAYDDKVTPPATPGGSFAEPQNASYRETIHSYDRINRLKQTAVVMPLAGRWDGSNFVIEHGVNNGPMTVVTAAYEYDAQNNVIKTTDANGNNVFAWYDALGRKTAQVDQELYLTTWTHDANGNVKIERRYANAVSAVSIDEVPSVENHANDRITHFNYDLLGRRTAEIRIGVDSYAISDSSTGALIATFGNAIISYEYNALGQVVWKSEANGNMINYVYDDAGRLIVEKRAGYTDHQGNFVNPTVRYYYDGLDQLTSTRQGAFAIDASDRITTNSYSAGRLASTTDAAGATRFYHYDIAGRVAAESYERTLSDGSKVTEAVVSAYDAAGQVVTQSFMRKNGASWVNTDASNQIYVSTHMRYNAHGEMTGRGMAVGLTEPASYQEFFDYDAAGRMWRTNSGDGVTKFMVYDKAGNQTLSLTSTGGDLSNLTDADYTASINLTGDTTLTGAVTSINVYDKRGMVVETREPDRELKLGTPQETVTIIRKRAYNAFGEVASETDARGYTTNFTYNTMGRLTRTERPTVSITLENGSTIWVRPSEDNYYDISGRLIGNRDANGSYATDGTATNGASKAANTGNLTTRLLIAGTGHGGSEAMSAIEYHADQGTLRTFYDRFGDARILRNELGSANTSTTVNTATDEQHVYDKMGRVTAITRRGGGLTDYYVYDEHGQRIQSWNSFQTSTNKARTDYDIQGRIVSSIAIGDEMTTVSYSWDQSLVTSGVGTFGGWIETTSTDADRFSTSDAIYAATARSDMFGRTVGRTDKGGQVYTLSFNAAGQLLSEEGSFGKATSYTYLNTGQIAQMISGDKVIENSNWTRRIVDYQYDVGGALAHEKLEVETGQYVEGYYDYKIFSESYDEGHAEYDALGRITRYQNLTGGADLVDKRWVYDAVGNVRSITTSYVPMNPDGTMAGAQVPQPQAYWYRYDSMNRVVTTKGEFVGDIGSGSIQRGYAGTDMMYNAAGERMTAQTGVYSEQEVYSYNAAGQVTQVTIGGVTRATTSYDALGRINAYVERDGAGNITHNRFAIVYDTRGLVLAEKTSTKQGSDWVHTHTINFYSATGTGATPPDLTASWQQGSASGSVLYFSRTKNLKSGSMALPGYGGSADGAIKDTETEQSYVWRDGAMLHQSKLVNDHGTSVSTHIYAGDGALESVQISGGNRPRAVSYINNAAGQIIHRREYGYNSSQSDPASRTYLFGGRQMGVVSNNGTDNVDYATSIAQRNAEPPSNPGAFRGGATTGIVSADFDANFTAFNGGTVAGGASAYTVNGGETLQSIAASLWGDSSLWYKLADANGLSAGATLTAGQTLMVPAGVTSSAHNADTFKPYDPAAAIGDVSPNTPTPKKNKCGVIGQVIATVVSMAASWAFGPILGNIYSQGFNNLIGIQKGFNWNSLGIAAISAEVSLIVPQDYGALSGAVTNAATQGLSIAFKLQEKFSWAEVAAAAVSAGVTTGLQFSFNKPETRFGAFTQQLAITTASNVAYAATRSAVEGTSFGDNVIAVLPNIVGQMATYGIQSAVDGYSMPKRTGRGVKGGATVYIEEGALDTATAIDANRPTKTIDGRPKNGTKSLPNWLASLRDELEAVRQTGDQKAYEAKRAQLAGMLVKDYIWDNSFKTGDFSQEKLLNGIVDFTVGILNFSGADYSTKLDAGFQEHQYDIVIEPFLRELSKDPNTGLLFAAVHDLSAATVAAYRYTPAYKAVVDAQHQVDRVAMAGMTLMFAPVLVEGAIVEGGIVLSSEIGIGTRLAFGASLVGQADALVSTLSAPFTERDHSLLAAGIDKVTGGNHGSEIVLALNLAAPAVALKSMISSGWSRLREMGPAFLRPAAKGAPAFADIATPYGPAFQSLAPEAIAARSAVEGGAPLYRLGTIGRSEAAEAQFWALEHPLNPGYAARYGIPPENVAKFDFIEIATLKPGTPFVTRPAPGIGSNPGGGIEVVTPQSGVTMKYFGRH